MRTYINIASIFFTHFRSITKFTSIVYVKYALDIRDITMCPDVYI